jgi:hypothetical protein
VQVRIMATGASRILSYDISAQLESMNQRGFEGFRGDAAGNQMKRNEEPRHTTFRKLCEIVWTRFFTIMFVLLLVLMAIIPPPESVMWLKEVMADWCTPSLCFIFMIVGIMITTSGMLSGSKEGGSQEQITQVTDTYSVPAPPATASQTDRLSMPDLFYSPSESARGSAAAATASPMSVRVAQPISVTLPPYYPTVVSSHTITN